MLADPCKKGFHLLFTMSLKSVGRRPSLPMAGMYQASANLAGKQFLALNNADTILPQSHHYQTQKKFLVHKRIKRFNFTHMGNTFFSHGEWRHHQDRKSTRLNSSHANISYA